MWRRRREGRQQAEAWEIESRRFGTLVADGLKDVLEPRGWHPNVGAASADPIEYCMLFEHDDVEDEMWFYYYPSNLAQVCLPETMWPDPESSVSSEDEAIEFFARSIEEHFARGGIEPEASDRPQGPATLREVNSDRTEIHSREVPLGHGPSQRHSLATGWRWPFAALFAFVATILQPGIWYAVLGDWADRGADWFSPLIDVIAPAVLFLNFGGIILAAHIQDLYYPADETSFIGVVWQIVPTFVAALIQGSVYALLPVALRNVWTASRPRAGAYAAITLLALPIAFGAGVAHFHNVNCSHGDVGDCDLGFVDGAMWAYLALAASVVVAALLEVLIRRQASARARSPKVGPSRRSFLSRARRSGARCGQVR